MSAKENPSLAVHLYDTAGTPRGARAAAFQAHKDGSLLILGPVGQKESKAAAEMASALRIPIALLSPKTKASNPGAGVFRLVLSPSFEAEQAAIVAVELGYWQVAVMAPRDDKGREQAAAFVRTARKLGAEIIAQGDYDPEGQMLERDFRKFLGIDRTRNKRFRAHLRKYGQKSWKSFVPQIFFDFLYMPDTASRGSLAASYLPFFNVQTRQYDDMDIFALRRKSGTIPRVVQLMGASGWLDPSFTVRGGSAVEGALIVGTCPGGIAFDVSNEAQDFHHRFKVENGFLPSQAVIMAYDAMQLIASVAKESARQGATRSTVIGVLQRSSLPGGVCGRLDMDRSGQVIGEIEVLRIEGGATEVYQY